MIKPKMAEGSKWEIRRLYSRQGAEIYVDKDGDLNVQFDEEWVYCSSLDVIRALVESNRLPLWDAAVKVATTAVAMRETFHEFGPLNDERVDLHQAFVDAVSNLCRVVDEMKEPAP